MRRENNFAIIKKIERTEMDIFPFTTHGAMY